MVTVMPAADPRPRWQVASALGATQIFSFGTTYYLLGALSQPIEADTGWSATFLSGSQTSGMLLAGLISPVVGRTIQKEGGRRPLALGFALFAAGLALLGASINKPMFIAGWLVLGLGMALAYYDGVFAALGKLFGVAARPAISTVTLWGGFASTVCWPLSAFLLDPLGWRGVCFVYAAIHLAFCIPLVLWSLAAMPETEARGSQEEAPPRQPTPFTPNREFYLVSSIFVANGFLMTTVYVHLMEFVQAQGLTMAQAIGIGALLGPAQVGARALELAVARRMHPATTLLIALGSIAGGLALFASGFGLIGLAVILFAAGNGVYSIVRGTLPLALFGPETYPTIMGLLGRPLFIVQAMAPLAGAWLLESLGAQATLWLVAAAALLNLCAGVTLVRLARR